MKVSLEGGYPEGGSGESRISGKERETLEPLKEKPPYARNPHL